MTYESFLTRRGFEEDPFAYTDSDRESRLSDYFVPPPYFAAVMGTPSSPEPSIVFAPRGGGKSAQRRMVESASQDTATPFLCITYSDFEAVSGTTPTLADHHLALSRLLTLALLAELEAEATGTMYLNEHDKLVLKVASQFLLSNLSADEFRTAISAVKTLGDKAGDLWRKYGGVAAALIGALMAKLGVQTVALPADLAAREEDFAASAQYFFTELVSISRKLAWRSVYILVDRVDETSATSNNPQAAYNLISQLVTNLPTLELPGAGFKFFLWDQLTTHFRDGGGRSDRVAVHDLSWSVDEISDMLSKRLLAYSNNMIENFNELLEQDAGLDAHSLLAHLCYGSPRDMIRMAKQVIAEATRVDQNVQSLDRRSILAGIHTFSRKRTTELYDRFESDFFKFQDVSFVTSHLSNDIFRISDNAMRQKIQQWTAVGAIRKMTELVTGRNRPQYVYTFTDLRIAIARSPLKDLEQILNTSAIQCPSCARVVLGSHPTLICECGNEARIGDHTSLLQLVSV